jgi:hypothetical protein
MMGCTKSIYTTKCPVRLLAYRQFELWFTEQNKGNPPTLHESRLLDDPAGLPLQCEPGKELPFLT